MPPPGVECRVVLPYDTLKPRTRCCSDWIVLRRLLDCGVSSFLSGRDRCGLALTGERQSCAAKASGKPPEDHKPGTRGLALLTACTVSHNTRCRPGHAKKTAHHDGMPDGPCQIYRPLGRPLTWDEAGAAYKTAPGGNNCAGLRLSQARLFKHQNGASSIPARRARCRRDTRCQRPRPVVEQAQSPPPLPPPRTMLSLHRVNLWVR